MGWIWYGMPGGALNELEIGFHIALPPFYLLSIHVHSWQSVGEVGSR